MYWLLLVVLIQAVWSGVESSNCTIDMSSLENVIKSQNKIIQIDLDLSSSDLKLVETPSNGLFNPVKWFIVRGERTNRLLLLFYYYYGYFEPYIIVPRTDITVSMNSGEGCFYNISTSDTVTLIRRKLLGMTNFPGSDAVFKENEVCSMFIKESFGFGILIFRCCKLTEDEITCLDVEEDSWIWTLRVFITAFSIILFLYFPKFIPRSLKPKKFKFTPKSKLEMSILRTRNQLTHKSKLVLSDSIMMNMPQCYDHLHNLKTDTIYNTEIESIDLIIQRGQILSETDKAVSFRQLLYDLFIRFKIRHVDAFQVCCSAPICGTKLVERNVVPWHQCLSRMRTVMIYLIILIPALPFLFYMCAEDTDIIRIGLAIHSRGLLSAHSFHPGPLAGKFLTGFLCALYILHVLMVLSIDSFQNEISEIIGIKEDAKRDVSAGNGRIVRSLMSLFTKYGLLAIPILILLIILSPLLFVLYILINAPVITILMRQFTKLCGFQKLRSTIIGSKCGPRLSLLLFVSLLSVFVILTIGINFLLHCLSIIIVNILINWYFAMSLISILVLIIVYVRDSAKRLEGQYNTYFKTILKETLTFKIEQIQVEADKSVLNQNAMAFQVTEKDVVDVELQMNGVYTKSFKWDIKHNCLRFRTLGVVLFLDKHDVPFIPRRLFEEMTYIDCPGCPGPLFKSLCQSLKDLGVTGIFLLFLFLLVMSYGETISVTPTTRFFATLATGLVPLLLRSFVFSSANATSLNTATLRFRNNFLNKLMTFEKRWKISDLQISVLEEPFAFSLWKKTSELTNESEEVDILINTSFKVSADGSSCCCLPSKIEDI